MNIIYYNFNNYYYLFYIFMFRLTKECKKEL